MSPFTKLMECRVQSRGEPKEEGSGEAEKGGEKRREDSRQVSACAPEPPILHQGSEEGIDSLG